MHVCRHVILDVAMDVHRAHLVLDVLAHVLEVAPLVVLAIVLADVEINVWADACKPAHHVLVSVLVALAVPVVMLSAPDVNLIV